MYIVLTTVLKSCRKLEHHLNADSMVPSLQMLYKNGTNVKLT